MPIGNACFQGSLVQWSRATHHLLDGADAKGCSVAGQGSCCERVAVGTEPPMFCRMMSRSFALLAYFTCPSMFTFPCAVLSSKSRCRHGTLDGGENGIAIVATAPVLQHGIRSTFPAHKARTAPTVSCALTP